MAALGDLLGRCDPDPVRQGRQFECICQWFLRHDPVYARELRQKGKRFVGRHVELTGRVLPAEPQSDAVEAVAPG